MERTKNKETLPVTDGRIQWKNTGGGSLTLRDKRTIKPGETFFAFDYEISAGFRDVIKQIGPSAEPELKAVKLVFTLKARGGNWFDVLDQNGKVKNEKALKKTDAEALIKSLEG